ncbi:hypothetical protein A9168_02110 [Macellibacteroides sp. HH-ZS]|nr:hypothetical protein A9168_02110 [Macellibacteroides sp. HH-ZS]
MKLIKKCVYFGILLVIFVVSHIYATNGLNIRAILDQHEVVFLSIIAISPFLYNKGNAGARATYTKYILFTGLIMLFCGLIGGNTLLLPLIFLISSLILVGGLRMTRFDYLFVSSAIILDTLIYYSRYEIGTENGIAIAITNVCVVALCVLLTYFKDKQKWFDYIVLSWMFLSTSLLFATHCRGGLYAIIIVGTVLLMDKNIKKHAILKSLFLIVIFYIGYQYVITIPEVYEVLFNKWGSNDISSNRFDLWSEVFITATLFGNGIEYLGFMRDAHNSFVDFLGCYGIIPFTWIIVTLLYKLKKIEWHSIPIGAKAFFIFWLVLSMTENLNPFTTRFTSVTLMLMVNISFLLTSYTPKKNT